MRFTRSNEYPKRIRSGTKYFLRLRLYSNAMSLEIDKCLLNIAPEVETSRDLLDTSNYNLYIAQFQTAQIYVIWNEA